MAVVDVFHALGDPTRLKIVEQLSQGNVHSLTSISQGLVISRQGVRKHIQILADANIITLIQDGRTKKVTLDTQTLERGKAFIEKIEQQWDKRLHALKEFVEKEKLK